MPAPNWGALREAQTRKHPGQMALGTLTVSPTCSHHTARRKAEALELNAAAVAEGIWPATPQILDGLARLAAAVVWDLEMAL